MSLGREGSGDRDSPAQPRCWVARLLSKAARPACWTEEDVHMATLAEVLPAGLRPLLPLWEPLYWSACHQAYLDCACPLQVRFSAPRVVPEV